MQIKFPQFLASYQNYSHKFAFMLLNLYSHLMFLCFSASPYQGWDSEEEATSALVLKVEMCVTMKWKSNSPF